MIAMTVTSSESFIPSWGWVSTNHSKTAWMNILTVRLETRHLGDVNRQGPRALDPARWVSPFARPWKRRLTTPGRADLELDMSGMVVEAVVVEAVVNH